MAYSDITFKDKNPIKAWLQSRRLVVAAQMGNSHTPPTSIVDFGAGNGELCKLLAQRFPQAKLICYEPTPNLLEEARANLADLPQVVFCDAIEQVPSGSADLVFCLEVFEHLPLKETQAALAQFNRVLTEQGQAVIGVPVEIGLPALYKGIFRMSRRFGAFDASISNVLRATFGRPPTQRPVAEIAPGFAFHFDHLGFDHRQLHALLAAQYIVKKTTTSPFSLFGPWLNPEANFLLQKHTPQ